MRNSIVSNDHSMKEELKESIMGVVKILSRSQESNFTRKEIYEFAHSYVNEQDCNKRYMLFRDIILRLRNRC
ncbi:hypothetical protein KAJ27_05940 [bacterium]|nr:hypothetical protein [bacterium]